MSFIWPAMLLLLLFIPLFAVLYVRIQRQRQQFAARYGTLGIVQDAANRPLGPRRHIPAILFLTGLTILLISLARPEAVVSLPRLQGTIILAFDVSGSMAATDLEWRSVSSLLARGGLLCKCRRMIRIRSWQRLTVWHPSAEPRLDRVSSLRSTRSLWIAKQKRRRGF